MATEIRNSFPHGPLSEERLREFEENLGVRLPTEYRQFLKEHNGGRPKPGGFWIERHTDASEVHQFYGLHDGPEWLSIDCYAGADRYGIPPGMLAIGDDGVGNHICIWIEGDERGAITFVDHELHPYDQPHSLEGVTRLASSFAEFLSVLRAL
jgi:cell wall assembly regulator SMI1